MAVNETSDESFKVFDVRLSFSQSGCPLFKGSPFFAFEFKFINKKCITFC